jgi:hypothetical protein
MRTEHILKDHIKTFDNLLIEDIWKFLWSKAHLINQRKQWLRL